MRDQNSIFLYIFIVFIVLLAGLIKTCLGMGAGIFSTPLLSLVLNPKTSLGLLIPVILSTGFSTLYIFRGKWSWNEIKFIFPSMIVGVVFGTYYVSLAPPNTVRIIIGIIAILYAVQALYIRIRKKQVINWNIKSKPNLILWKFLIGFFAGISSAVANSGGIIITIYLATIGLTKETFVATLTSLLLIGDISKFVFYIHFHILTKNLFLIGLLLTPIALSGSLIGRQLMNKLSDKQYTIYMNILIAISGILLICKALF